MMRCGASGPQGARCTRKPDHPNDPDKDYHSMQVAWAPGTERWDIDWCPCGEDDGAYHTKRDHASGKREGAPKVNGPHFCIAPECVGRSSCVHLEGKA